MIRLWAHMRSLWPRWTLAPVVPFVAVFLLDVSRRELRVEHVLFTLLVVVLAYGNARTKKLLVGLYPFGLVALVYDTMRLVKNVGVSESTVHLCDLRGAELRLFGVTGEGGVRETLQDWFQAHPSTVLDLVCAVPYGTFIYFCFGYSVWAYFKDFRAMQRFTWLFFLLNVMGFVTYHVYPAAPPWYFHTHGCVVDVLARSSEGPNLARVDALLGVHYFQGLYGRSNDVFGAVPSLHVAYPLVVVLDGWRLFGRLGKIFTTTFWAVMCFAAVYLDHHWVIDVLLGLGYAFGAFYFVRWVSTRSDAPAQSMLTRAAAQ